jgi:hypothetical protein
MGIPGEIRNRPHSAQVRQTSFHAPKSQRMQIQLPDGCEIALGSVMAIVISGLGRQFTQC